MRIKKYFFMCVFTLSGLILASVLLFPATAYAASASVTGKAKVLNTDGYFDFSNYNSNVKVDSVTGKFSGYVFSEDLGWVEFGTQDNSSGPVSVNLTVGPSYGHVTGKAKVLNTDMYIDFGANNSSVKVWGTSFMGYVFSEDLGWIDFADTGVTASLSLTQFLPGPSISITGKAKVLNTDAYFDFSNYNSNVKVDGSTGIFSGYVFSEDLGWVAFGIEGNSQGPVYVDTETGEIKGKAKVLYMDTYIDFGANNSNVKIWGTFLKGYVFSEDLGWIDFSDTGVTASALVTQVPVAYWKFDEGTGQIVHSSTYLNDGTLGANVTPGSDDPTWAAANLCIVDKCLSFDGGDYVKIGSTVYNAQTVSFWVKPSTNNETLLDLDGGTHYISASGGLISATGFGNPTIIYINGKVSTTLTAGVWQHIEITTGTAFDATSITLGKHLNNYFTGYMDDVKIYPYIRTQDQVLTDYNAGKAGAGANKGTSVSIGNPTGALIQQPIAYYRFNEGSGTVANNSIGGGGSAPNGTISNGTWTNDGKFGKALTFGATTSVTATITDPGYSNSISLWVYPTTSAVSKTLVTSGKLSTSNVSKPTYGNCTGTALSLSTWTHIVAESDGSGICKIYQDGVQTASSTTGVTFGTSINIGGSSFTGSIDDFKFYNYPLTPDEVKVEYNAGSALKVAVSSNASEYCVPGDATNCATPIAEWNFEESLGGNASDISGNGATGTATGTTVVNGKIGKARNFTTSDNITATITNPAYANTLEAWVYPATSVASKTIITNLTTDSNSKPVYGGCTGTALPLNQWTYITAVSSDSTHCSLYQNGIPVTGGAGVTFGTTVNIGNSSFTGEIDAVKIYNYARTPTQVAYDYNRGLPIAWWKFNETSGMVANDSSGNSQTGAITTVNFIAGKLNNALSFNGASTFVSATVSKSINSVSFWMQQSNTSNKSILDLDGGAHTVTVSSNAVSANGFSTPTIYVDGIAKTAITDSNWHHVVITSATAFTASTVTIGKVSSAFYTGALDDVRLYNYPLTATQVKTLYNEGAFTVHLSP